MTDHDRFAPMSNEWKCQTVAAELTSATRPVSFDSDDLDLSPAKARDVTHMPAKEGLCEGGHV